MTIYQKFYVRACYRDGMVLDSPDGELSETQAYEYCTDRDPLKLHWTKTGNR